MPTIFNLATPDQNASKTSTPRVFLATFGGGYEQRLLDGCNPVRESWALRFSNRPQADIAAVEAFLVAMAGVHSFVWTTPEGLIKAFKCAQWTSSYRSPGDADLACTFEQVFESTF